MKLVLLMYLEEDEPCVARLLEERGVEAFSRLPLEGHGPGREGWRGVVPAYRSRMVLAVVPEATAANLIQAVRDCRGIEDPAHPVRAVQVAIEEVANCLCGD
ncbi:MAG TPA: hypothetical protein VFS53_04570 [Gemmatimonadota bacterium]|nr:hypothetical protein [Gemmatimonadota bacterium]